MASQRAVIVHGMPLRSMYLDPTTASPSNYHWIPWLQKQLILKGVLAQAPEMPTPYAPDFAAWRESFERFRVDEATTLIGWSGGGGFLVRWLSECPDSRVRKIVLSHRGSIPSARSIRTGRGPEPSSTSRSARS